MNNFHPTYSIPVSIKGIIFDDDKVWLRKNERQEWELPGGKLDTGEQPEETVAREIKEELGFYVEAVIPVQAYVYMPSKSGDKFKAVFVVSYLCKLLGKSGGFEYEGEAGKAEFKLFSLDEVKDQNMPEFYKAAIRKAAVIKI